MKTRTNTMTALCGLIAGMLSVAASANADTITLNDGGVTKLEVVARDRNGNPGLVNQIEDILPTSLPFDGSHVATQQGSHSQATYHLGLDAITITSSGTRNGSLDSRANVQPFIFFSVSVDTHYSIIGSFSVNDPGASAQYAEFTTTLTHLNASVNMFHSSQASRGVVDASFLLGGTAGNRVNELTGSAEGILTAGHQYRLYYGSSIYADTGGDSASYVGEFSMRFAPVPEPSSMALFGGALFLLIWRRRSSTAQ